MSESPFNSTVSDLAATLLTNSIVDNIKRSEIDSDSKFQIDNLTPSLLIGSAVTQDLNYSKSIKPTIVLTDTQKDNIIHAFHALQDRVKLSLCNEKFDNLLFSKDLVQKQMQQAGVFQENSKLLSLTAEVANNRHQQQSEDGSSSGDGKAKIPDKIRDQIHKLNAVIANQSPASGLAITESLKDFWDQYGSDFEGNPTSTAEHLVAAISRTTAQSLSDTKQSIEDILRLQQTSRFHQSADASKTSNQSNDIPKSDRYTQNKGGSDNEADRSVEMDM